MVKRYPPQAGEVEQVSSRQVSRSLQAVGDKKAKVRKGKWLIHLLLTIYDFE